MEFYSENKFTLPPKVLFELVTCKFEYRSLDGSNNNLDNVELGQAGRRLLRLTDSAYSDGVKTLARENGPSPRELSNIVFDQNKSTSNINNASALFWVFGQFIDHDLNLSGEVSDECVPIVVPSDDEVFPPGSVIPFKRSGFDPDTGTDQETPREQTNEITSWLDLSAVYGSSAENSALLRSGTKGLLKTSSNNMPPINDDSIHMADPTTNGKGAIGMMGDARANENIGLFSIHTLFIRFHNTVAEQICNNNLHVKHFNGQHGICGSQLAEVTDTEYVHIALSDEQVFERARLFCTAVYQQAVMEEFLSFLIGKEAVPDYEAYDPTINAQILNEFSTVNYRLHTLVGDDFPLLSENGHLISNFNLRDVFFKPQIVYNTPDGVEAVIRGLATITAEDFDGKIIDSLRNFLFGMPGAGGLDLVALNIQRGRDHGIADYNSLRKAVAEKLGVPLQPVPDFLTLAGGDQQLADDLSTAYGGDINQVDPFVGVHLESKVDGSMAGETSTAIIRDQFLRVRDGDRFWFERYLPRSDAHETLAFVKSLRLSDIVMGVTSVKRIQKCMLKQADRPIIGHSLDKNLQNHLIGE